MFFNSKLSSFLIILILGNSISTKFSNLGFFWFQSSEISLKPGFEQVIVKFGNCELMLLIVSMILGFICPEMTLILFNLNRLNSDFGNRENGFRRKNNRNNGNVDKLIVKYNELAREALSNGDKILSENYYQYADHFLRISVEQKDRQKDKSQTSFESN